MPDTKKNISDKINEILGTTIDFTPLRKEDLEELYDALQDLNELGGALSFSILRKPLKQIIDMKAFDKPIGEMSVIEVIRHLTREKGLLGLGILPKVRRLLKGEEHIGRKEKGT